ncbi:MULTISPECIES: hypothetical protein [Streptomyces]|uniref:hypothetical protein n=1 Tax=Streptomyces TaxID=1883 RepID=UPI000B10F7FF|nr:MULTISPECIES: hypothetical protein [Streptomyces]
MAKNKNRDRGKHQDRSGAEHRPDQSSSSSTDSRAEQIQERVTPSETPHKGREKRFGHN